MILVGYTASFIKKFSKLNSDLQEEFLEKIDLFKNKKNHEQIKVHKLKGKLGGRYSFSVNYKYRIVFLYKSKNNAVLLSLGSHDVYK